MNKITAKFAKLSGWKHILLIWILTFFISFGITLMILALKDLGKY